MDRPDDRRGQALLPLLLLSGVVVATVGGAALGLWAGNVHNGVLALTFTPVGAFVVHDQPRNRCGAVFLATGVVEAVMFLGRQVAHDPGPGTSPWWGWFGTWPLVVGLALVTLSVILFPDGRLPSPGWRWVVRTGAALTAVLAVVSAVWPVGTTSAGVLTPYPFSVGGDDAAASLWDALSRPTFVAFQVLWLAAVVARWRVSGPTVRRQLTVVGLAVGASLVALCVGLVGWGTPTPGLLAVCLVPLAAGWAIVHGQYLATHAAFTWLVGRSPDDDSLPADLARAVAGALDAEAATVWVRRHGRFHVAGTWPSSSRPEPAEDFSASPGHLVRWIGEAGGATGAITVVRALPPSRHDERLLDGFCAQAALVLAHVAAATGTADPTAGGLDHLTDREREVLGLMARGYTNAAICDELHLSIKTVEPVVSSIFGKLGLPADRASNRRVLAVLAYADARRDDDR
ncbi:helix-turn-helix domain-containing protein [Dermatobacter hominis]|uniref:helix-turn-helix domain-containing protein n=1 Tax=Dermatobacter hominis TaxID=2884263 RepID=UPI001D1281C3|nr:helix-turn-helix transcriptional regulator [Dermatobacter hominis]UDY36041.1 helix-turn-helix transcriptional regulator [Dermatobacter hominis]